MLTLTHTDEPGALDELLQAETHHKRLGQRLAQLDRWFEAHCAEHGITRAQYNAVNAAQNGRCAICLFHPIRTLENAMGRGFRLHLDADAQGILGLLCLECKERKRRLSPDSLLPWERRNLEAYLADPPFRALAREAA
jgi:hypothetical protein